MERMKKIVMIIIAIMLSGLIYFGVQRYLDHNKVKEVIIQSLWDQVTKKKTWDKMGKDMGKGATSVATAGALDGDGGGWASEINPGEVGSMCSKNSDCKNDNYCSAGMCQKKLEDGGICFGDADCKNDKCRLGVCQASCVAVGLSCKDDHSCCSKNCIVGTCRNCTKENISTTTGSDNGANGNCCPGLKKYKADEMKLAEGDVGKSYSCRKRCKDDTQCNKGFICHNDGICLEGERENDDSTEK
jgi:hypothetical protein